ncbi:uncharacterized protein Dvir_GJ26752 [Drosophila virilis]|uniref:Uncharacterized protein n=1 Tax=Drosophila virilis TaxID=7244 RepID=A0A0Q9WLL4_DROVI|nr:uncharacterized protein LOC26531522 [Drosophila virilis]KRF81264.1 uncharacterized protein Dvir_GJ26752 [Drosophila virilis]
MTRIYAIAISCILHLGLCTSFFIHQSDDVCSETIHLPAYLVYLSLMDLIYENELIPSNWRYLPVWPKFIMELMVTVWLGEVCLVFFWSNMEKICVGLLKTYFELDDVSRIVILNCLMLLLSGFIAWLVGIETRRMEKLKRLFGNVRHSRVDREMNEWILKNRDYFNSQLNK